MSKSRKRKSSKGMSTGTTLAALALIISMGALGLGLYQFILPTGPTTYTSTYSETVLLYGLLPNQYIPHLNVTYNANAGDRVLLEYSCNLYLDYFDAINLRIYFDIDGTHSSTYIFENAPTEDIWSTCYMKHYIESSDAGIHNIRIDTLISQDSTNSYIKFSVLTVTVY